VQVGKPVPQAADDRGLPDGRGTGQHNHTAHRKTLLFARALIAVRPPGRKSLVGGEVELFQQGLALTITEAAQAATQIAASSQQQLAGMAQVAGAMDNIKQASAQNVASAKQLQTAARNLDDLGQRLKHLTDSYTV